MLCVVCVPLDAMLSALSLRFASGVPCLLNRLRFGSGFGFGSVQFEVTNVGSKEMLGLDDKRAVRFSGDQL